MSKDCYFQMLASQVEPAKRASQASQPSEPAKRAGLPASQLTREPTYPRANLPASQLTSEPAYPRASLPSPSNTQTFQGEAQEGAGGQQHEVEPHSFTTNKAAGSRIAHASALVVILLACYLLSSGGCHFKNSCLHNRTGLLCFFKYSFTFVWSATITC